MKRPLLAFVVLLLCYPVSLSQASSPSPTPSISIEDYRSILDHERKLLDDQSEKYFARVDSLINRSLWVFGIIFSVAAGLFLWQYGKTKSEMRTIVREQFKEQAASLIDQEMSTLRGQIETLNRQVAELQAANNKEILWIFSGTETSADTEREQLIQRGMRNISLLTPAINEDFNFGDPALVVFSYDKSAEGLRRLGRIVEILRTKIPIPSLIIYTYDASSAEFRLGEPERRVLGDFRWYLPVNYPVTLISQTQFLLRDFRAT